MFIGVASKYIQFHPRLQANVRPSKGIGDGQHRDNILQDAGHVRSHVGSDDLLGERRDVIVHFQAELQRGVICPLNARAEAQQRFQFVAFGQQGILAQRLHQHFIAGAAINFDSRARRQERPDFGAARRGVP